VCAYIIVVAALCPRISAGAARAVAKMNQLMAGDKGGRRADIIALDQTVSSPMNTVTQSPGGQPFSELMERHPAENHSTEDKRQERNDRGYVHFQAEPHVPDVGGVGWRTRTGHMLKNQAYYSSAPATNKWDLPVHAGVNSWKDWHGPRLRTDAPMMERLDHYEEENDHWEAKKCFVNTTRAQTLDRFYNKKLSRDQLEAAGSWAPHRRAGREISDHHEHFFGDLDSKPEKELKKVLTPFVLQRDRDAVRAISGRIQNEETWKLAWKHMEQERRQDIRHDFTQRQSYNDLLMQLSGQPVRQREWESQGPRFNNCSQRTIEISAPKGLGPPIVDVTSQNDFRGLFHADNEHALEALYPGNGHQLSVEFRQSATDSTKAGWPAPPAASTPRMGAKRGAREKAMREKPLTKEMVPISKTRLDGVATRVNDECLRDHSKAQFLSHVAPPPPDQRKTLMKDDFSPKTMMQDPGRVTGLFQRTEQGSLSHLSRQASKEALPPAQRSFTYPVMAPTSPNARGAQLGSKSPISMFQSSQSTPALRLTSYSNGSAASSRAQSKKQRAPASSGQGSNATTVGRELDQFESTLTALPRVSNFFGTPRSHRRTVQGIQSSQSTGSLSGLARVASKDGGLG